MAPLQAFRAQARACCSAMHTVPRAAEHPALAFTKLHSFRILPLTRPCMVPVLCLFRWATNNMPPCPSQACSKVTWTLDGSRLANNSISSTVWHKLAILLGFRHGSNSSSSSLSSSNSSSSPSNDIRNYIQLGCCTRCWNLTSTIRRVPPAPATVAAATATATVLLADASNSAAAS